MQKELGAAVRSEFALRMKDCFPQFELQTTKDDPGLRHSALPGSRLYRYSVDDSLHLFVLLYQSSKFLQDWFMIEIGWNRNPTFPSHLVYGRRSSEAGRLRLPDLYKHEWNPPRWQPWWQLSHVRLVNFHEHLFNGAPLQEPLDVRLSRVRKVVDDAICHLRKEGWNYFLEIARQFGREV